MADESGSNGDLDGFETSPVLVCDVGAEKRHDVRPELIAIIHLAFNLPAQQRVLTKSLIQWKHAVPYSKRQTDRRIPLQSLTLQGEAAE